MIKVLIAVDGSEDSVQAACRAVQILGPDKEYLVMEAVHETVPLVANPSSVGFGYAMPPPPEVLLAAAESAEKEAQADVATVGRRLGVDVEELTGLGPPADVIRAVLEQRHIDLLVVGSHGKGFARRLLLGSVSHELLNELPCPVLVVPVRPCDEGG